MPPRKTLAFLQQQLESARAEAANTPVAYRLLTNLLPFAYECAKYKESIDVGDDARLVVYAFDGPRDSLDLLIGQIATGAGEGILHVEWHKADDFVSHWERQDGHGDVALAYKIAAEYVRRWTEMHHLGADDVPQCVIAMGCYCAGHARGNSPDDPSEEATGGQS